MASRTFTVETRDQSVVIFGGPKSLTNTLIQEFLSKGLHATKLTTTKEFEELKKEHDPDYLVVFPEFPLREFVPSFEPLIKSGESRLIMVNHQTQLELPKTQLPITKQIIYSDYVGDTEFYSQVIEAWISEIKAINALTIPGDGLGEISLIGETDLARLMALSILAPQATSEEKTYLGNPTLISFLNLAYVIRTALTLKLAISFKEEDEVEKIDSSLYEKTLQKLGYQLVDSPELILSTFIKYNLKMSPASPSLENLPKLQELAPATPQPKPLIQEPILPKPLKAAPTEAKKLTPLKTFQPIFVPLQTRKPKRVFKLPQISFSIKSLIRPQRPVGPPRPITIVGRGLLIAIALYLGTIAFAGTITSLSLRQMSASLKSSELPPPNNLNNFAFSYLQANWVAVTSIPFISSRQAVIDLSLLLDAYSQTLSILSSAQELNNSSRNLTEYILGNGSEDVAQVVSLSRLQAEELYQKLSLLDGSLPLEAPSLISAKYQAEYQSAKAKLGKLKRSVTTTKALLATIPDVIGLGGRRKYAVIFQNNLELRATGGFIGSFAILSFENGKLYDMPIFDVYDVDGQLKGHIEPPKPIKDILGESNWYLRDSNFDPDFPTTARRIEWFIKKALNQDLDGTIALNANTLVSLLKSTGQIDIPDYNEQITAGNLQERSMFHAEGNFFPGSTKKKEFLSTVASTIFTKISSLNEGEGTKLLQALYESIQEKNTLISLINTSTAHVLETLGWTGQLTDYPCPTPSNCHKDYLMVVDSNFGVNKANFYLKREIEETITLDQNLSVTHILRLKYENSSSTTAWPAGTYKNYERLYLPIGTTVSSIKVADRILETKDYVISQQHGKLEVAYLFAVPINSKVMVEIAYNSPQLPQENEFTYTWHWQKQPGTSSSDKLVVYLNYPAYLNPIVISPNSELTKEQLKFDLTNDSDHRITVKFAKYPLKP